MIHVFYELNFPEKIRFGASSQEELGNVRFCLILRIPQGAVFKESLAVFRRLFDQSSHEL